LDAQIVPRTPRNMMKGEVVRSFSLADKHHRVLSRLDPGCEIQ
jgi:hypothetical protein